MFRPTTKAHLKKCKDWLVGAEKALDRIVEEVGVEAIEDLIEELQQAADQDPIRLALPDLQLRFTLLASVAWMHTALLKRFEEIRESN